MRRERPEPRAISIELEVPPFVGDLLAVDRIASVQELFGPDRLAGAMAIDEGVDLRRSRLQDPRAPSKECLSTRGIAGPAHLVGADRPIAKPAAPYPRELR